MSLPKLCRSARASGVTMLCGIAAAVLLCACASTSVATPQPIARIPRDAARFEIDSVTDSTAIFRVQESTWIRAGMAGYAVDPRQRDALVARVRISGIDGDGRAVASVTSQVALVKRDHVLLLVEPERRWWRQRSFWSGMGTGALLGVGAALVAR